MAGFTAALNLTLMGNSSSEGTYSSTNNFTATDNTSSVTSEKIHDPNANYPPLVNIGIPVVVIALFTLSLILVYLFPNKEGDETVLERMFPDKSGKSKRRRSARTNSNLLSEQKV